MSISSLPAEPSSEVLVRLIRARQFLEHAKSHAAGATDFDYMIATHSADNAVEFLLKLIADHVAYEEVLGQGLPDNDLAQIAGDLSRFLRDQVGFPLPYLREIKILRQIRNLVQHGSFTPGADIERQLKIAERFFSRVCEKVFGLDVSLVRVASVITNPNTKGHLAAAEHAMDEGRFEDSIRSSRNAFEEATYVLRSRSPIAISEVPARVEMVELAPEVERYLGDVSEELDALRLKVDANRFDRFREITSHLPSGPEEPYGYAVMQRPWERADAEFCYGFVTENVLRWQEQAFGPLYALNTSDHRHVETVDGIPLSDDEPGACLYDQNDHQTRLLYVGGDIRFRLMGLEAGNVYRFFSQHYENTALKVEISYQARLRSIRSELATHDPVRWKIVLDIVRIPLSWHRLDYQDGLVVSETPSLQDCTATDLEDLYPVDADIAARIIEARERAGMLTSDILRQVDGITSEQIDWIESFMRA